MENNNVQCIDTKWSATLSFGIFFGVSYSNDDRSLMRKLVEKNIRAEKSSSNKIYYS